MEFNYVQPGQPFIPSAAFTNAVIDVIRQNFHFRRGFSDGSSTAIREAINALRFIEIIATDDIPQYSIFTIHGTGIEAVFDPRLPIAYSDKIEDDIPFNGVYVTNYDTYIGEGDHTVCYIAGDERPFLYYYDDADGTPALGDPLGPKVGTYKLTIKDIGFLAVSAPDTDEKMIWAVRVCDPFIIGKALEDLPIEGYGYVEMYDQLWSPTGKQFYVLNPHQVVLPYDLRVRFRRYPGWIDLVVEPFQYTECPPEGGGLVQGTFTQSATSTLTQSFSQSFTQSLTPTGTLSVTGTEEPSITQTLTWTQTQSISPTSTPTATQSFTVTETPSSSPSSTLSPSISASPSATLSASISASPSPSATPSASISASPSPSATPSASISASISASPSPSATPSATISSSLSESGTELPGISWYNASSMDETDQIGSILDGTLDDTYSDNNVRLDLAEVTGTPGFNYEFIFGEEENVPSTAISLHFNGYYQGNVGHAIKLYQWNYNSSTWDAVTGSSDDFPHATSDQNYRFELFNDPDYLSGGQIKLRIRHTTAGSSSHHLYIDHMYLQLLASPSTSISSSPSSTPSGTPSSSPSSSPSPTVPPPP